MGGVNNYLDSQGASKNGVIQMVLGSVSIILQFAVFTFSWIFHTRIHEEYGHLGHSPGIWAGIFYIISGVLTYLSGKQKKSCLLVAALTLNLISLLFNVAHVILVSQSIGGEDRRFLDDNSTWMYMYSVNVTLYRWMP
jgi:hypothetical protein